ncbi:uncharacterized protein LOC143230805 isoform X2 [Tachypleus tridentatus]|uniref:uncharacterized protein LOC143230805 isoform X2 n=1 Tax=Tachypleus tridentatus TaxID=6853 RepID=UPI003FD2843D
MDSLKRSLVVSTVTFTLVESIWSVIWSLWAMLLLENPQPFITGKNNSIEMIAESFKQLLSEEDVHFGFVVFEMILSIFWALCGISLLYGYLKKNITFVIPWIVITSIVLLYDISTSVFYLNLLVSSLKKQAEDTSVETITNNIALVFLLLGFSRFGITFLCINVILFILVVTSTMEYWKIKDKDLLGSSAIEPDMRSQFQPDERYSHPKIPRRSIDNIRQSSSFAHILPHSSREPSTRDQDYTKRYYDNDDRSHSASRSDQERPDIHMLSRGRLEPETSIQPRISRPSRIC